MDDLSPPQAAGAGYEYLYVYHCRMIAHLRLDRLPDRPLSRMRFRCQRCGQTLSPEIAQASYRRMADTPGHMSMYRYPT